MSNTKQSFMRWNEMMGYGDGHPREYATQACKYCGMQDISEICSQCQDIIDDANMNDALGRCPVCHGRTTNMDGTTCDECGGRGLINVEE